MIIKTVLLIITPAFLVGLIVLYLVQNINFDFLREKKITIAIEKKFEDDGVYGIEYTFKYITYDDVSEDYIKRQLLKDFSTMTISKLEEGYENYYLGVIKLNRLRLVGKKIV